MAALPGRAWSTLSRLRRALGGDAPVFDTEDVEIGARVTFGKGVRFHCERVRIGDGCSFGDGVVVRSTRFRIGDYGTIYDSCFFPGPGELTIGHNFWLGTASIVDSQGGTTIGNNVGVGAHSQLWTHMKFGDTLAGCRFHSQKPLVIEDDVWLVGHCLVSPVRCGARSLAMLGSLVTKDMETDHIYAGVPAKDVTAAMGSQFAPREPEEKRRDLLDRIAVFAARERVAPDLFPVTANAEEAREMGRNRTAFDVVARTYAKHGTDIEHRLIRYLLPDAKFLPLSS